MELNLNLNLGITPLLAITTIFAECVGFALEYDGGGSAATAST